ncbi:MAG: hypothetical protein AAGA73_21715 [Pseudomonadota bacterium]
MPKLIALLLRHAAFGFLIALVAVTLMMITDFANLRTLITESDKGVLALVLLTFFLGLTIASVQMGIAVIRLRGDVRSPDDNGNL